MTRRMVVPARKLPHTVPLILDLPACRRRYLLAISVTRNPRRAARICISTVHPKSRSSIPRVPSAPRPSARHGARSVYFRPHSRETNQHAKRFPKRWAGVSAPASPGTSVRLARTKSASPRRIGSTSCSRRRGSSLPSASKKATTSSSGWFRNAASPARHAAPYPDRGS